MRQRLRLGESCRSAAKEAERHYSDSREMTSLHVNLSGCFAISRTASAKTSRKHSSNFSSRSASSCGYDTCAQQPKSSIMLQVNAKDVNQWRHRMAGLRTKALVSTASSVRIR